MQDHHVQWLNHFVENAFYPLFFLLRWMCAIKIHAELDVLFVLSLQPRDVYIDNTTLFSKCKITNVLLGLFYEVVFTSENKAFT